MIFGSVGGTTLVIVVAGILLAIAATFAAYIPARRATRVAPFAALRQD